MLIAELEDCSLNESTWKLYKPFRLCHVNLSQAALISFANKSLEVSALAVLSITILNSEIEAPAKWTEVFLVLIFLVTISALEIMTVSNLMRCRLPKICRY